MTSVENGKRSKLFYDISAAFESLEFSRAFGPGILAAFFYGFVSGSMSFVNKVSWGRKGEYANAIVDIAPILKDS